MRRWAGIMVLATACEAETLRVATLNVRGFGVEDTDQQRLTALVRGTGAAVVALQEVMREGALAEQARRLDAGGGRWRYTLSACGGRREMHLGFLYDAS